MGHLTLTTPLSWKIFHRRVGLAMVSQGTKFEVSRFIHYEAMNGSTKCIKMGWFGMVSGHSRSWTMPPFEFDRAHTTLYWTLIETMRLSFSPSVRCRCWLGDRKGIRQKTEWWGTGMVICQERGLDLHMAQLMPLPLTVSCFSDIQIGFTFYQLTRVVPEKGPLNGCVCVYFLPLSRYSRLFVKSRRF